MSKQKTTLLPVLTCRQEETDAIVFMMCAVKRFREAQEVMNKRLRMTPNGWRDIRMITSVLDKLVDRLTKTLPPEKNDTLSMLLPDTRVRITYTRQIGKGKDHVSGILTRDLDMLTSAVHDSVCKLCDGNCDRCDIGKVFDRFLNTERQKGESYTYMNIDKGFDVRSIRKGK